MRDLERFIETLRAREFFDRGASVIISRAPGRLDIMGGIADYSGSLVLQLPTAEATFVAIQSVERPVIEILSIGRNPYTLPLESIAPGGKPLSYAEARKFFAAAGEHHWSAYVAGIFLVLIHERRELFSQGARIAISSNIPEGKGVASSAALETATMQAVASTFGIRLDPQEMALLCQKAENLVVGAPCGIMDQMTCICGERDSLLALLCQPAELHPPVPVPAEISFWGLDSGERHSVGGGDYGLVRTGAFMGFRIITDHDARRNGYLANVPPSVFEREFLEILPDQMSGEEFLTRYSNTADTVTTVNRARVYRLRRPTAHPVYEHHRVQAFRQLLLAPPSEEQRRLLGELMYQSHASYSACGLGSPGTDLLVDLVRGEGPPNGLYGARITGGGLGGTVAILGRVDASPAISKIAEEYERTAGHRPYIFAGSSPGVSAFGSMTLTL